VEGEKVDRPGLLKKINDECEYYSRHTRSQYFNHITTFLDWLAGNKISLDKFLDPEADIGRDTLKRYLNLLQSQGHSQSHVNYIIRGPLGCIFRAKGLKLPVKLPPVKAAVFNEGNTLFWAEEQIASLVQAARLSDVRKQAIMALATIYAPRASEIVQVHADNIDKKKGVITIHTFKHNLVRRHLIPDCLKPIFYENDWEPLSDMKLRELLDMMVVRAGLVRSRRLSFHGFRHALFDELSYLGFNNDEIYEFTGWVKGVGLTLGFYTHPLKYNPNNDIKIFAKHPFLKYWEE
jgi:integrase